MSFWAQSSVRKSAYGAEVVDEDVGLTQDKKGFLSCDNQL